MDSTTLAKAPHQPAKETLWLYRAMITKLTLCRTWSAPDGNDEKTTIEFFDENKKESLKLLIFDAKMMVDFTPTYCCVCQLKDDYKVLAHDWIKFTKTHAEKLAEFARLKNELGL